MTAAAAAKPKTKAVDRFYERANMIAAKAILEKPEQYAGALLDWARRVVNQRGKTHASA